MTKFTLPNRVDKSLAQEGTFVPIYDELGNFWGEYKLVWMDVESQRGRKFFQAAQRKFGLDRRAASDAERDAAARKMFVNTYLVDWKLPVEMTGGKPLPYSVEVADELFSDDGTQWLLARLLQIAGDITTFAAVIDADGVAVEPEKN